MCLHIFSKCTVHRTAPPLTKTGQQRNILVGSGRQECKSVRKMQKAAESGKQISVLIVSYTALGQRRGGRGRGRGGERGMEKVGGGGGGSGWKWCSWGIFHHIIKSSKVLISFGIIMCRLLLPAYFLLQSFINIKNWDYKSPNIGPEEQQRWDHQWI